jgi:RNA polymerase-binding transcription factor DksA
MTAPVAMSQHSARSGGSPLATAQADTVRAHLLAEAETHGSALARCTAALVTSSPDNMTDLARALNALRMYEAREALEEIAGALARVEAGRYGICLACERPIPREHLATTPQARFCAACSTPASPKLEAAVGPRLGPGRGEHTGTPSPVRSPQACDRPPVQSTDL